MGLTDSSPEPQIEHQYRLVRRFTSDIYGDLTIVQHHNTHLYYALKQFVTHDEIIIAALQHRRKIEHRSLVKLEMVRVEIEKVSAVYEYCPRTLDEELQARVDMARGFADAEVLAMMEDLLDCLDCMVGAGILHLLGGIRMVLYDEEVGRVKILQTQDNMVGLQRRSGVNLISYQGNKRMMPLHPFNEPRDVCDMCLDAGKVTHQNLFVLGLMALGLCMAKDPMDMSIFSKGSYNFQKIDKRINQIKSKFPMTHAVLNSYMSRRKSSMQHSYSSVLGEINKTRRETSKQNEKVHRIFDIQPVEKLSQKRSRKLSYLCEMRLSNNDIPNQF